MQLHPGQPHFLTHLIVRGGRDCQDEHAICSRSGKRLANILTVSIAGSDGKDAKLPPGTDPAIPVVTLTGDIVSEADEHGTFTIQIDRPAPQNTTVEFGVYGVSAEEGKDFTGVPDQVIEIAQGTSEASVKVPLIDDQVTEHAEVLKGFITNAVGADLDVPANQDPLTAEILIRDNEEQPAGVDYVTGDTSSKNGIAVGDSWLNGDPVPGRIETENDEDWYVTNLRAGRCYQIEIRGKSDAEGEHPGAEGLTLTDPYLNGVYRDDGVYLPGTTNRDGGTDLSALHTIRFNRTGAYYIAVSHGWYNEGGTFDLSVPQPGHPHQDLYGSRRGQPHLQARHLRQQVEGRRREISCTTAAGPRPRSVRENSRLPARGKTPQSQGTEPLQGLPHPRDKGPSARPALNSTGNTEGEPRSIRTPANPY